MQNEPGTGVKLSPEQYLNHLVNLTNGLLRTGIYADGHGLIMRQHVCEDCQEEGHEELTTPEVTHEVDGLLEELILASEVYVEDHLKDPNRGEN